MITSQLYEYVCEVNEFVKLDKTKADATVFAAH